MQINPQEYWKKLLALNFENFHISQTEKEVCYDKQNHHDEGIYRFPIQLESKLPKL